MEEHPWHPLSEKVIKLSEAVEEQGYNEKVFGVAETSQVVLVSPLPSQAAEVNKAMDNKTA